MSDDMNHMQPGHDRRADPVDAGRPPDRARRATLHARVRYFDPARRRAGLPEHVGALVERITEDEVTLQLVNLDPVDERTVIVQGGAYAEHQITTVQPEGGAGPTAVDHPHFAVRLAPGAGVRLVIARQRYANQPTLAIPGRRVSAGIIDTHVHVWCRGTGPECRPRRRRGPVPTESVPVEWLIDDMGRTGISYAVLVQSSAFGTNNRYIVECLHRFPGKFRAIGLVHPLDTRAPRRLKEWASRGVSGFRFHPVFFEDPSWLDAPSSDRIWDAAEETDSILQFHVRPEHGAGLASIAARHPNVRVIVDHLGKPDVSTEGSDRPILALAELPNVWIKIGDYQIASEMDYPWPISSRSSVDCVSASGRNG